MEHCKHCGQVDVDLTKLHDGTFACEECMEDLHYWRCEDCEEWYPNSVYCMRTHDDRTICSDCSDNYLFCDSCGELYHEDDIVTDGRVSVCESCFEYGYVRCDECGTIIDSDYAHWHDDGTYCDSCFEQMDVGINSYNYKPEPIFKGNPESGLYYGVELEVDDGSDEEDCANELHDVSDSIYMKHDGSLDDGFEIVTHPASLKYHMNGMNWHNICKTAVSYGYRSHDTNTCGLHIHASRDGLGETESEQDLVIAKLMLLFDRNWDNIVKFSRRNFYALEEWAKKLDSEIEPDDDETMAVRKSKMNSYDRYRAINLTNTHTIEFRVFRGSLKPETVLASIQFVDTLITVCKQTKLSDMARLSWKRIFDGTQHKELKAYLESRDLVKVEE